ncbi:MAG: arsenosugar biosynthesis radical SAM (seleno)protein ArsS [Flavobacteriaceae bacterium]
MLKSLHSRADPLASTAIQLARLEGGLFAKGELPAFKERLQQLEAFPLQPRALEILQVNLGYLCNQVCAHCHVDAGPDRKEIMSLETIEKVLEVARVTKVGTLDLTGGAPEMNPHFTYLVEKAKSIGIREVIVRSNLTILEANPTYKKLPAFFKEMKVRVVSSLPHYSLKRTDKQRGEGVFSKSIAALKNLNALGYGSDPELVLDLVYNPSGAFLSAEQTQLERDFKSRLNDQFGIVFNQLFCINNLPISRFLDYLIASDNFDDYMQTLVESFNPATLAGVMCTNTLSVSWNGVLYDCDFNQMLEMPVASTAKHINDFHADALLERPIRVNQHCYGCTAGSGSSCQGSLI